jgi:hypothetical protein
MLVHPLAVTYSFKSVHCVGGNLATQPSIQCFSGDHLHVYLLGLTTLIVEAFLFPLFIAVSLGVSLQWCCCAATKRRKDRDELKTKARALEYQKMTSDLTRPHGDVEAEGGETEVSDKAGAAATRSPSGGGGNDVDINASWHVHYSEEHKKNYYEHRVTRKTQWEVPSSNEAMTANPLDNGRKSVEENPDESTAITTTTTTTISSSTSSSANLLAEESLTSTTTTTTTDDVANKTSSEHELTPPSVVEDADSDIYGSIHGGLCCRWACCVAAMTRSRAAFHAAHDRDRFRSRRLAYSTFTQSDYKPEFFFRTHHVFNRNDSHRSLQRIPRSVENVID